MYQYLYPINAIAASIVKSCGNLQDFDNHDNLSGVRHFPVLETCQVWRNGVDPKLLFVIYVDNRYLFFWTLIITDWACLLTGPRLDSRLHVAAMWKLYWLHANGSDKSNKFHVWDACVEISFLIVLLRKQNSSGHVSCQFQDHICPLISCLVEAREVSDSK